MGTSNSKRDSAPPPARSRTSISSTDLGAAGITPNRNAAQPRATFAQYRDVSNVPPTSSTVHDLSTSNLRHGQASASATQHSGTSNLRHGQASASATQHSGTSNLRHGQASASATQHSGTSNFRHGQASASATQHSGTSKLQQAQPSASATPYRSTSNLQHAQPSASATPYRSTSNLQHAQPSASATPYRSTSNLQHAQPSASATPYLRSTSNFRSGQTSTFPEKDHHLPQKVTATVLPKEQKAVWSAPGDNVLLSDSMDDLYDILPELQRSPFAWDRNNYQAATSDERPIASLVTSLSSATGGSKETVSNGINASLPSTSTAQETTRVTSRLKQNATDTKSEQLNGYIKGLKSQFGFVRSEAQLPDRFTRSDLYFRWKDKDDDAFASLHAGQSVRFVIDESSSDDKPSLKKLSVVSGDAEIVLPIFVFNQRSRRNMPGGQNNESVPHPRSRSKTQKSRHESIDHSETRLDQCGANEETLTNAQPLQVDDTTNQPSVVANQNDSNKGLSGTVVAIKHTDRGSIGFIKPNSRLPETCTSKGRVMFYIRDAKPKSIVPTTGDRVRFVLGTHDSSRSRAIRVYIQSYSGERPASEFDRILTDLLESLSTLSENQINDEFVDILSGLEVWKCIGNCKELSDFGLQMLIQMLQDLRNATPGLQGNFKCIIKAISDTFLFSRTNGRLATYVKRLVSVNDQHMLVKVKHFILMVTEFVPEKTRDLSWIIKPMVSKDPATTENVVFKMLRNCLTQDDANFEDKEWTEMPLVPTTHEILDGPLEGAFNLQPVKPTGAYDSAEEYFDIYFRLLRADCFSALNKGVRDLLGAQLDARDMKAYHSVLLYGIHLGTHDMPVTIAIQLKPFRAVKDWKRSSNLMFGNLVCISVNGTFRDAIWGTVISRDLLPDKRIVMLELCTECNTLDDAEAIHYLEFTGSNSVLVESPTYYRAYQPVLKNLQQMDPNKLPFQEEIIGAESHIYQPDFVTEHSTVDGKLLYDNSDTVFVRDLQSVGGVTTLDRSQEGAFKNSLTRRVAVVQGPPGTGKTFIGVKLVQALESLSTKPDTPIVLLTYKNHALDEFMKQLSKICPDDIARIGGRQQDPEIARFNLSNLRRQVPTSRSLFSEIMDHRSELQVCGTSVADAFAETCSHKRLNFNMFLTYPSTEQLENILLNCNWSKINMPSVLQNETASSADGGFSQVKNKKKRKQNGPTVDLKEIRSIIEVINDPIKEFLQENQTSEYMQKLQSALTEMIFRAFEMWLPNQKTFQEIRDKLNSPIAVDISKYVKSSDDEKKDTKSDDADDGADQDAKDEEDERKAATDSSKESKIKVENIIRANTQTNSGSGWTPEIFPIPKNYQSSMESSYLLNRTDMWGMTDDQRVLFVQLILHKEVSGTSTQFTEELLRYKTLFECKRELETLHSVRVLQEKKFVGMTITGASIHCKLLAQLRPAILVVEEAAEVMEPQLLSCLGPWVQQLILIGDHQQLRPSIESYELKKNYHLDVSLMERLINNGLRYSTLTLQNRMRPEFAEMLKDIYPELESNMKRVEKNHKPPSSVRSMFFWCHRCPETGPDDMRKKGEASEQGRSYTNDEEAERCVNLALFFVQQGHQPNEITILGAYLGQVKLLRKTYANIKTKYPECFNQIKEEEENLDDDVIIQTIDNYQGDENNIVIISLVRSNPANRIGFLHTLNRRCVAQSRARCGMYFIGNDNTLSSSIYWEPIIDVMTRRGELGPNLPLQCPNHNYNRPTVTNASDVPLKPFCHELCGVPMVCGIHMCTRRCQPIHTHNPCKEIVPFTFPCGHPGKRKCYEEESKKVCDTEIKFLYPACKTHYGSKYCWEDHRDRICEEEVIFYHPCSHIDTKLCHEDAKQKLCKQSVTFTYKCRHTDTKLCHEDASVFKCSADVHFIFTSCKHPGTKKCGEEDGVYSCEQSVSVKLSCGHTVPKKCFQSTNDVKCKAKCSKLYPDCKHPCSGICSEPCNPEKCKDCLRIKAAEEAKAREEMEKKRKAIRDQVDKEIELIKTKPNDKRVIELLPDDSTAVEYYDVTDMVMRYIQPMHNWYPKITKIEKIVNNKLFLKFLECRKTLIDPTICQLKFHGTDKKATESIMTGGFLMPKEKKQMYGPGIYFATDSSKSAREIYTKDSGMLLLCEVLLGKAFTAKKERRDMTAEKLKALHYDSLFAPRGSDVLNDEFVVYNPDQALPKYVIHFTKDEVSVKTTSASFVKHTIVPQRTFKIDDPLQMHLRIVESQFFTLRQKYTTQPLPNIKSIDYYINPPLVAQYHAKKALFEATYGKGDVKSEAVLAFHGTDSAHIPSIVKNNFDTTKIKHIAHGWGIYFSEFPEISTGYGNALLLCRVLPGKSYVEGSSVEKTIPAGYDSIAVKPDSEGRAKMLVIGDPSQILPCYVVNI